jgi:hypothetical protein
MDKIITSAIDLIFSLLVIVFILVNYRLLLISLWNFIIFFLIIVIRCYLSSIFY